MPAPYSEKLAEASHTFLSTNSQDIGVGLSDLEVRTSCQNLEMDDFDDYIL
jgi:hypothetical protein